MSTKSLSATLTFLCYVTTAAAAQTVHITCPVGPYDIKPFTMIIDYKAKTATVVEADALSPLPGELEVTDETVSWGFMRGFVVFHRDTNKLEWDTTAEYDYLNDIGQAPQQPRDSFVGASQCTVDNHDKP
jgi:hypothetical protein